MTRRECFQLAAGALAAPESLIGSIEHQELWSNLDGLGVTWFHPRICRLPSTDDSTLLMTVQTIGGSDVYGPVHWSISNDLGRTWPEPEPIPGMGRREHPDGIEEGYSDTVPEFHAKTGTVLAMAQNLYYRDNKLTRPNDERWPVYIVRRMGGGWGPLRKLEWNNPEASAMYSSNCAQRVTFSNGDILVPLSFGPTGRPDRAVCTARYSFDGEEMKFRRQGNVLRLSVGRGLLEPSVTLLDNVFYMTIRAENGQGFVTSSRDGLEWDTMRPWAWEDGEPLSLSTTQQRWLPHSERLFLVYTRKDPSNLNVMRWRAPLFLAEVDPKKLCLIRATERIAIPLHGDGIHRGSEVEHLGNFHATAISPDESLISSGTVIPANFRGVTRIARIRWSRPNRLV